METVKIAEEINSRINMLSIGRKELQKRALDRADALMKYEKALGSTMLKLRNNAIEEYDGLPCQNLPATMIEKVAKSICWQEKLNAEETEALYKVAITGLQAIQSELNGFQSMNKFVSEL